MKADISKFIDTLFSMEDDKGTIGNGNRIIEEGEYHRVIALLLKKASEETDPAKKLHYANASEHLGLLTDTVKAFEGESKQIAIRVMHERLDAMRTSSDEREALVDDIESIDISHFKRTLYRGMSDGQDVKELQKALKKLGFYTKGIDGNFGGGTESAVLAFQAKHNLGDDAIVWNGTLKKILSEVGIDTEVEIAKLTDEDKAIIAARRGETVETPEKNIDTTVFNRVMKKGQRGPDIVELQKLLAHAVWYTPSGSTFNAAVERAVIKFQEINHMEQDGVVGNDTMARLLHVAWITTNVVLGSAARVSAERRSTTGSRRFETVTTRERVSTYQNTFMGIPVGSTDRAESFRHINQGSIEEILKKYDLSQIISDLKQELGTNNLGSVSFGQFLFFTDGDTHGVSQVMKKYGYDIKGAMLDYQEAAGIVGLLNDYNETQNRIPSMTVRDKVRILFDFNQDGSLTIGKHFYVGELQMDFHTFESITSDGASALFRNLGLGSVSAFTGEMRTNLFTAREKFQRALGVALSRGMKPGELVRTRGTQRATAEQYRTSTERVAEGKDSAVRQIGQRIDEYIETNLKYAENFRDYDRDKIANALKLEAVGLLVWNGTLGVWASFDVRELDAFIDSLQIWIVNGIPWIVFSKKLFEEKGFQATASLANFIIPVLSASYSTARGIENFKRVFPTEIETTAGFSVYASVAPGFAVVGGSIERVDESTSTGIEKMTEQMAGLLKEIVADIKAGKAFSESSFSEYPNGSSIYAEMKSAFDTYAKGQPYADQFLTDMAQGYLGYYESKLYQNAAGLNVSNFGAWVAFLAGFLPIPYLTIGGEHISTDWDAVLHSLGRERTITAREIGLDVIGATITTYRGKQVLAIPNGNAYQISNSLGLTQAEIVGGTLYLWGDLSKLTLDEHTTHEGVTYTLVIGEGRKYANGLYKPTARTTISSGINQASRPKRLASYDVEAIKEVSNVRSTLFQIIQVDALNHAKTVGLQKLQREIFSYKNEGTPALAQVWEQFISVVTHTGFAEYAQSKGVSKQDIDRMIAEVQWVDTDNKKVIILQTISATLMKKDALQLSGNTVTIEGGKTINEYDATRAGFFDGLFCKRISRFGTTNTRSEKKNGMNLMVQLHHIHLKKFQMEVSHLHEYNQKD